MAFTNIYQKIYLTVRERSTFLKKLKNIRCKYFFLFFSVIILCIVFISSAKGTTPVVVINLWTLCNKFDNETKDTVFGGRLNKIKQKFGDFLSRLVDSGAELYFVFKNPCRDEQRNFQIWSQTEEREYANGIMMIEKIDELKRIDKIVKFYEKKQTNIFNKCFPFNNIISVILAQTAENYGTICGPENVNTITTTNHARLANLKNAMAIIGLDTHYFFYEGLIFI